MRKALDDVFGDVKEAYHRSAAAAARRKLSALAAWLISNGEETAARRLKEGLEETLTVLKLNLPSLARRSLSTTNTIGNLMSSIRRGTRNVKRWQNGSMVRRRVGLGVAHAHEDQRLRQPPGPRDRSKRQRSGRRSDRGRVVP